MNEYVPSWQDSEESGVKGRFQAATPSFSSSLRTISQHLGMGQRDGYADCQPTIVQAIIPLSTASDKRSATAEKKQWEGNLC